MPSASEKVKASWADQMDEHLEESFDGTDSLPASTEVISGDNKIVTEYKLDENGKKVKTIRYYKIEKRRVPQSIAKRKAWKKFGMSANDSPGPNPATTIISEDIFMQFVGNRDDDPKTSHETEDDGLKKLQSSGKNMVQCRYCGMDHWSLQCPYKDKLGGLKQDNQPNNTPDQSQAQSDEKKAKYVPPNMREGGNKRGETMTNSRNKDEANTIRVTNLPEEIQDQDLKELFSPFGRVTRIFLAKDKYTGQSKGFAFVSYEHKDDAAKAIRAVHGYGYANLILNVEWAKPSNN